jgi:hypothetical protein
MIQSPCFVSLNGNADEPGRLFVATGQTVLHAPSATFLRQDNAGTVHLGLTGVSTVSFAPGSDIETYRVQYRAESVTHCVQFVAGGEAFITYDNDGDLIDLQGAGLRGIRNDSGLVIGPLRAATEPGETRP